MILLNKDVYDYIKNADSETLEAMVTQLSRRRSVIEEEAADVFVVGQSVTFLTKNGQSQSGIIEKINRKSILIRTDAHKQWRVSPSLLKPDNFYAGT